MAIHGSGLPIDMDEIAAEFGGNKPYSLSTYIRNGAYVPDAPQNANIPTTLNNISMDDFYGAVKQVTVTYEIIGGGGGGAGGETAPAAYTVSLNSGDGYAGSASTLSSSAFATITASGGSGGASDTRSSSASGSSSYYGSGGAGGLNSSTYANVTDGGNGSGYGAGGGSGGTRFGSQSGGNGGGAGTRKTGTLAVTPATTITVVVGAGGAGRTGAAYLSSSFNYYGSRGGDGRNGYVKLTVNGVSTQYTSAGTYTYTVP